MDATYTKPGAKSPFCANAPIIQGVAMPERLLMPLNAPPVSPMSGFGATEEIMDQPIEAIPFPKKARVINPITAQGAATKFAMMIEQESNNPVMMGILRAVPRL